MGFFRGLWAPFRGAAFVVRHRLWLYLLAPLLLNAALITGAVVLGVHVGRRWLGTGPVVSSVPATIGIWAVAAALGLVFFVIAQPVFVAPFVDALTEKAELLVRGQHPKLGFWTSAWRAVLHGLLKLLCYVTALVVVWSLTMLTGVGGGVGALLSALLLAYDGFDYPLARRGAGFGAKWRYLLLHPGQTLGYCVGASLLYLIPPTLVVAPAFAAVGATLAFLDTADTDTAPGARVGVVLAADKGATSV
jgi:uncharacterized protein involved in cysteine biosynthesis